MKKILMHMLVYIILAIIVLPIFIGITLIAGGEDVNIFRVIVAIYCFVVYALLLNSLESKEKEIKRLKDLIDSEF